MTGASGRLLLFGGSGQVGQAIQRHFPGHWNVSAPSSDVCGFSGDDFGHQVRDLVASFQPTLVVNAAAYTAVDDAEDDAATAFRVNAEAPGQLASCCAAAGVRLVHLSTDYVFDGLGEQPYPPSAPARPLNVYGASKLAGEAAVMGAAPSSVVVRTAWVHAPGGANFIAKVAPRLAAGESLNVVADQVGSPTAASTLAEVCLRLAADASVRGLMHVTDAGVASWYDVACCVLETLRAQDAAEAGAGVRPVTSDAFPTRARRPRVSVLDTHETWARLDWTPPHWRLGVTATTLARLSHTTAT